MVSRYSCKNIYAIFRRQHLSFFNIASDIFFAPSCFFLQFRAKWNRKEILSKREIYYKFARSNFELTMAIMAAISKKKWTFAMRTGKRLIKNRFYAAFYYNRLFRRNVESNDPYDARLNAIVIAAEQKKKKKKVQHVSSLDYFARKLLYKERDRVSRFFKLIRDNISP